MMKIGSIKTIFFDWLKNNIGNILIVLIIIFACIFALSEFQKLFDSQQNFIQRIEENQKIRDEETKKFIAAYDKEQETFRENIRIYEERMIQIEENYRNELLELEKRKNSVAHNIIVSSNNDSEKVAEAVSSATGFRHEKK